MNECGSIFMSVYVYIYIQGGIYIQGSDNEYDASSLHVIFRKRVP